MNRRNFLRLSSGLIVASQIPPSLLWPHRKIFLPPVVAGVPWGAGNSEFETPLNPEVDGAFQVMVEQWRRGYVGGRMKMSSRIFETPAEEMLFHQPEKVKAIDPITYRILYGNASTDRS